MSRIISIFSNTLGDLESLKKEFKGLNELFNSDEVKTKIDYEPLFNEPISVITSKIIDSQSDLKIFHFSGHSSNDGLDLQGEDFSQQYIIDFFGTINDSTKNLDCVILNGCDNQDIVNQLSGIPVVIGSKSPIQDETAKKFTNDFFSSLIKSGKTYRQAFADAVVGDSSTKGKVIDGKTRGEGSFSQMDDKILDKFFMVINDSEVADNALQLKKKPFNWVRFIALLALLITTGVVALFWNPIIDSFKGYSCPEWADNSKCRIFVADFLTEMDGVDGEDINELLAEGLEENEEVNKYLESRSGEDFDDLIKGNGSVTAKNIHKVCDFDISMTGKILKANANEYNMDIVVYSDLTEFANNSRDDIEIGSLSELNKMVQNVGKKNSTDFIMNRFCIACGEKNPELLGIVERNLVKYKQNLTSVESYQSLNKELYNQYDLKKDTVKMIEKLDEIADVGNNDYVLGALEKKSVLVESSGTDEELVEVKSEYLEQVQMRIEEPSSFKTKYSPAKYQNKRAKMLDERTKIILKDTVKYKKYLPGLAEDIKELQGTKYRNGDYRDFLDNYKKPVRPIVRPDRPATRPGITSPTDSVGEPVYIDPNEGGRGNDPVITRPWLGDDPFSDGRTPIRTNDSVNIIRNPVLPPRNPPTDTTKFVTPAVVYDVALMTYGTKKAKHYAVAKVLHGKKYDLSYESSGGQFYMKDSYRKPFVEYSHTELKGTAKKIAELVSKRTGERFRVKQAENLDLDTERSTIFVYWYDKEGMEQEFEPYEGRPKF